MNQDNITIRYANQSDIEKVTEFALVALNDSSMLTKFASDIGSEFSTRLELNGPEYTILAIDSETDSIIGFIEIDPDRSAKNKFFYVSGMYQICDFPLK